MQYLFVLGRESEISVAEIFSVLAAQNISYEIVTQTGAHMILDINDAAFPPAQCMETLGGTVKIAELVSGVDASVDDVVTTIDTLQPDGKVQFSVAGMGKGDALRVKKELKAMGRSVRYIPPKNTATILHNHLVQKQGDFTVLNNQLFVTRAIQPIEEFTARDYDRPRTDTVSGMLPPKVARTMINLSGKCGGALYDPFCGSGTVLMEALHLGFDHVVGRDLSGKAVEDSIENVQWVTQTYEIEGATWDIMQGNARGNSVKRASVDCIVSEPYMGKPLRGRETGQFLQTQAAELADLYGAAFEQFATVLKKDGVIVFVIPRFRHNNDWVTIDCLDRITAAGFVQTSFTGGPQTLLYWRKDQWVGRELFRFEKAS